MSQLPELNESLQILFCTYNQLTQLPKLNASLEVLHCSNNQLQQLPVLNENLTELFYNNNPCFTNVYNLIQIKKIQRFQHFYWTLFLSKQKCIHKWIWKLREENIKEKFHPNNIKKYLGWSDDEMILDLDNLDELDDL